MNINAWLVSEAYRSLHLDLMAVYKKDVYSYMHV